MHRAAALPRIRAVPRLPRAAVWVLAALALVAAGGLWLRDSSLVAVRTVSITGATGPEAAQMRARLTAAASDMTTLHVRVDQLRAVLRSFPVVRSVSASSSFPHTLRITVTENVPVAAVAIDGERIPVTGDGQLLRGAGQQTLPAVPLRVTPGGQRVVDRPALQAIAALAAAPPLLRDRVDHASTTRDGGLTFALRNGPVLRFGAADRLAAKWAAAAAVLASPSSAGATYLDLRYPERPAAGGLEDPATQRDPEVANSADPQSSSTPATTLVAPQAAPSASTTP
jgi:cell division protein FtsQ